MADDKTHAKSAAGGGIDLCGQVAPAVARSAPGLFAVSITDWSDTQITGVLLHLPS